VASPSFLILVHATATEENATTTTNSCPDDASNDWYTLLPAPVIAIVFLGRETVLGTSMSIPVFDSQAHIPTIIFSLHDLHRVLSNETWPTRIVLLALWELYPEPVSQGGALPRNFLLFFLCRDVFGRRDGQQGSVPVLARLVYPLSPRMEGCSTRLYFLEKTLPSDYTFFCLFLAKRVQRGFFTLGFPRAKRGESNTCSLCRGGSYMAQRPCTQEPHLHDGMQLNLKIANIIPI